ncbi:putative Sister chromatid cohesion protein pds5 [Glarea lozoyensis 74030]|nr:putative Sister chromatid cohesion protein pds5 [Glarea lozoyensis 74030]
MSRHIAQYFNDVIHEVTGATKSNGHRKANDADSEDEEAHVGPTEMDMKELKKAHSLLQELWRASPDALQNVIPLLEVQLSAEDQHLRLLATNTIGDIISGIGAAGPPPPPAMDPAAYPPINLEDVPFLPYSDSILTTPASPQSFSQTHSTVYHSFMGRKNDKTSVIRAGWTRAVGRILVTSAGGIGLSREEESSMVRALGEKLNDADDKVRLAAVKAVGGFSFRDIISKLAPNGSVTKSGSVLCSLADRARDRKHPVRIEAMTALGRIWGVAAGEIASGNESVITALGAIPSKIIDVYYANDLELNVLLDHVMFEQLLPLKYPPGKSKGKATNGDSHVATNGTAGFNADKIRLERILLLVKSLDPKSKKAFFVMQARQPMFAKVLKAFLTRCEEYNGGVMEGNAKEIKAKLDTVVKWLADLLPDPLRTSNDLLRYAKLHDRRSYQLLRFAVAPENDFKMVHNSIKEFSKRIETAPGAPAGLLQVLMPIIYRSSSLIYNKSHLPYIMQYAKSDEDGLGAVAHEIMHEISDKHPKIFEDNVADLCKSLAEQAPTASKQNDAGSVEVLKAVALFAKNPNSSKNIPRDRKFISTLMSFAQYGMPPKAAKYAVSILMATSNKKEMHAKDLMEKSTKDWEYGQDHFLSKLATISQLTFLEPSVAEDFGDEIIDITTQQLLMQVRTPSESDDPKWKSDSDLDEEGQAKLWAIRILVNRLRAVTDKENAKEYSGPVYALLNKLIEKDGEISKDKPTPRHHAARLRCLAAQSILKLCTNKMFEAYTAPKDFNRLACVVQDPIENVRRGMVEKLQKYLVKNKLPVRFYTIMFLTAFEPNTAFLASIVTWIRSRAKLLQHQPARPMESVLPRLISVLAHHPDFGLEPAELVDQARYIVFYLSCVVSEENLPLVYKYAERVKQARDALSTSDEDKDNIYIMSDLATYLIKSWQEKKGWVMQTWAGKVGLPVGLYAGLPSHEVAQEIAKKPYLPDPETIESSLDKLVRDAEKTKKRKSDDRDGNSNPTKKQRSEAKPRNSISKKDKPVKIRKTPSKPKRQKPELSTPDNVERRKSGRGASAKKVYADIDDEDADEEMLNGVAKWDYLNSDDERMEEEEDGSGDEEDQDEDVEVPDAEPEPEAEEAEPEPEPEPEEEEADEPPSDIEPEPEPEAETPEPSPPKSNGRKLPNRGSAKKGAAPTPKAATTPAKKKVGNVTPVKSKAKAPIVERKGTRSSGRNK